MKKHVVYMRYCLASFGAPSQLPTKSPRITVLYEHVLLHEGQLTWAVQQQVGSATDVAVHVQELALPDVGTYAQSINPKVTITIEVEQVPPTGFMKGYQVLADLVVDGTSVGGATYSAAFAAAQNPATPRQVTGTTEVWHWTR